MAVELRSEGIVVGLVDYGDSDRIVTFLTRERGRISAFAAGARRSKKRFAGALEPFTRLDLLLEERRGELFFLKSCQVRDGHGGLREDLGRLGHAGHAAELCRELCRDREPHEELYEQLAGYLASLSRDSARPEDLLAFELGALRHAGVSPRLDRCSICGEHVGDGGALCDPSHGGLVCASCTAQLQPGAFRASGEAIAFARRLQTDGPFANVRIENAATRSEIRSLVRRFTRQTLGRLPRSIEFMERIGIEG